MAKHVKHEKYVDKKINLACLLIALVLVIAAVFAYTTIIGSLDFGGVKTDISTDEIMDIIESLETSNPEIGKLFMLVLIVYIAILQIIALINVIRLVIGWFGFIGSKDSNKMAKKLVKHAKIAFGTMGTAIAVNVLAACDNGVLAPGATGLFVITGLCVILSYLAVRYYKWFVVEKLALTEWLFTLIRDVLYFVFPIFLFGFIGKKFIGEFITTFGILISGVEGMMIERAVESLIVCFIEFFAMLAILGIVKKTIKFLPFDSYKKPANKIINRKYRGAIIMPLILVLSAAVSMTFMKNETFVADYFVSYLLDNIGLVVKLILAAIAVSVASIGSDDEDADEIKLAAKKIPNDSLTAEAFETQDEQKDAPVQE